MTDRSFRNIIHIQVAKAKYEGFAFNFDNIYAFVLKAIAPFTEDLEGTVAAAVWLEMEEMGWGWD